MVGRGEMAREGDTEEGVVLLRIVNELIGIMGTLCHQVLFVRTLNYFGVPHFLHSFA